MEAQRGWLRHPTSLGRRPRGPRQPGGGRWLRTRGSGHRRGPGQAPFCLGGRKRRFPPGGRTCWWGPCSVGGAASPQPWGVLQAPPPALQGHLAKALGPLGLFPYLQGVLGGAVSFSLTWVGAGGAGATGCSRHGPGDVS